MRIAIIGAGALGGTFGFLLAEAGHDVTLVDVDRTKIEAVTRDGVTLIMPDGSRRHRAMSITSDPESVGVADLVQISVKGYHTASAAQSALPMLGPDSFVLSLQNGLTNLERIAEVVGRSRVLGGVTAHSAMPLDHTLIKYNGGMGGVSFGRYDGAAGGELERFVHVFASAGLEPHLIEGDVREPIWRKLLANVSVNPVAALTGLTGREIQEIEPARELVSALAGETAAVARAHGFTFPELDAPGEWVIKTLDWVGDNKVSMLQDVEAGRRTEVDTLSLAVVEEGEKLGVDTPLNWAVGSIIKIREQKILRDSQTARAVQRV